MAQYVMSMLRVSKIVPPKRQIIKDISLSFFPGAKIGLLGLNGSGKSTVLRIMAGVDKEYDGEVQWLAGQRIGKAQRGVNIIGVWNMAKAVYPYMIKQQYGRIINTSSVTGTRVVDEGQTTYSMTKGAVSALTRALAYEAGPHGITVNAVLPGWVRTPKVEQVCRDSRPDDPESAMRDMAAFIPLKRLCRIEEIGDLVAFLASDEATYITGTEMVIDGGSTLPETFDILHA